MSPALEANARLLDDAARELRLAADQCDVAAQHLREEAVPRELTHAWAARGYRALLDEQTRDHAEHADPRPG